MGFVRSLLSAEVHCRIARIWIARPVLVALLAETLLARPGLHQRAIHAEVFVAQQAVFPSLHQNPLKELLGDIAFQQSVAILAKHRGHPDGFIHIQSHEPAE